MDDINYDLSSLTPGERLWLWRRRQASPTGRRTGRGGGWMSANEAAAVLDVPLEGYSAAESGKAEPFAHTLIFYRDSMREKPSLGDLCLIARRRMSNEVLLLELCKELSISKPYFNRLEREGHPDVIDLWRRRGFLFPDEE